MNLRSFIEPLANRELSLDEFLEYRYYILGRHFPHEVFSVGQAVPSFFSDLLRHLDGAPFERMDNPSVYELNYRRWVELHRK